MEKKKGLIVKQPVKINRFLDDIFQVPDASQKLETKKELCYGSHLRAMELQIDGQRFL